MIIVGCHAEFRTGLFSSLLNNLGIVHELTGPKGITELRQCSNVECFLWIQGLPFDRKLHEALSDYVHSNNVPFVTIEYPKWTESVKYLYKKMSTPFPNLNYESLRIGFNNIVNG